MNPNRKTPANRIKKQFAERFLDRHGVQLLSKVDALQLVRACIDQRVRILGIDGFRLLEDGIQPSLENSVDFSSKKLQDSYVDSAFRDPTEFLRTRDDKMMFEIVYGD